MLSFLYAIGHALVVILLGAAAIAFGAALPDGVDVWMGRVVGVTLVALGAWVLIELIRKGRDFRLRSRWILVLGGTFAGLRRVQAARSRRKLAIEHEHEHEHDQLGEPVAETPAGQPEVVAQHEQPQAHDHDHLGPLEPLPEPVSDLAGSAPAPRFWQRSGGHSHRPDRSITHRHAHRHEVELAVTAPVDGASTGNGTAAGIGILHGVGVESPTQIAVFVASTSMVGVWAGMALLLAWVVGLVVANSGLAILAAYGLLGAERNSVVYATVAAFVGVASLAMGLLLLFGVDSVLPELAM